MIRVSTQILLKYDLLIVVKKEHNDIDQKSFFLSQYFYALYFDRSTTFLTDFDLGITLVFIHNTFLCIDAKRPLK